MSDFIERLQLLIDSSSKGLVSGVKEGETAVTGFGRVVDTGKQKLAQYGVINSETGKLTAGAWVAGGAVAGAAIAKFALDGVEKFAQLTSEVRGFQRVSGATAEDSSKLVFAVKELGIEPDAAASAFGRLATRLGTGKADLSSYGVEVAKNKDGTVDLAKTVANLSDAYQHTEDPTTRAALANEAFGRSWQTLAPLLSKGKADLNELYAQAGKDHQIFSQDDLEKGRQFTASMNLLKSTLEGLKVELGSAVIPVVTQGAQALTQGVQAGDQLAGVLGTDLGGALNFVNQSFNPLTLSMHGASAASNLLQGNFGKAGGELARAIPGVATITNLFWGSAEASNKFSDAQNRQQQASINAANAIADHGAKSLEARNATKDLAAATKDLEGLTTKVGKAMSDASLSADFEASALIALTNVALAASGVHISLAQAENTRASALADQADKQNAYNDAVANYGSNSSQAAAAARDLDAANTSVAAANLNVTNATLQNDAANKQLLDTYRGHLPVLDANIKKLQDEQAEYPKDAAAIQPQIDQLNYVKWILLNTPDHKTITVDANADGFFTTLDAVRTQLSSLPGIANVPGFDFITTLPGVPRAAGAEGAIVSQPTIALIGEAGPEALVPLNRMPGASALPTSGGGNAVIELTSVVEVAGSELARALHVFEIDNTSAWRSN